MCSTFTANTFPLYLCTHLRTIPWAPSPIFSYTLKHYSKAFSRRLNSSSRDYPSFKEWCVLTFTWWPSYSVEAVRSWTV